MRRQAPQIIFCIVMIAAIEQALWVCVGTPDGAAPKQTFTSGPVPLPDVEEDNNAGAAPAASQKKVAAPSFAKKVGVSNRGEIYAKASLLLFCMGFAVRQIGMRLAAGSLAQHFMFGVHLGVQSQAGFYWGLFLYDLYGGRGRQEALKARAEANRKKTRAKKKKAI